MSSNEYPDRPRVAVGAVVFKDQRVLLVQRGRPPARSLWAVPGGSVELGESLQQAAQREIYEETGVRIRATEPIFVFDHVEHDKQGNVRFHYVIVDLAAEYLGGEPKAGDDARLAAWIDAPTLSRLELSPMTRQLLAEHYGFGV